MEKEINQTKPQENRKNLFAKVKKILSAALITGMLASPAMAKEKKNKTTYNEPTRVERSAEKISPEKQALCDDVKNLFQDIVASDLSQNFGSTSERDNSNVVIVKAELKDYINRLDKVIQELSQVQCDYSYNMQQACGVLKSQIETGGIDHLGNGNLSRMIYSAVNDGDSQDYKSLIEAKKKYEFYYFGDMSKTSIEYDSKNDEWPGLSVYAHKSIIRNNPAELESGMKYISKNVWHLRDMMPDTCGPAPIKEAWIWVHLSTDSINEILSDLKENDFFKSNHMDLRPDRIIQQQADQEMSR